MNKERFFKIGLLIILFICFLGFAWISFKAIYECNQLEDFEWDGFWGYCKRIEPACELNFEGKVFIDANFAETPIHNIEINRIYGRVPCSMNYRVIEIVEDGII